MSNIKINLNSLSATSFKKTVRHKIQEGSNIFRFLPPFGVEANGAPYRKWNVVWGLIDPNSGRARPFASPSTYEGKCPVYDYLDILKEKIESLGTSLDEAKTKEINEFISNLRPKSVYAYNAANKAGELGVLELKATAHKKVIAVMAKYINDYDQDPTSLNSIPTDSGLWFNVTKAGRGFDTTYDAIKNQSMVKDANGIPSYQDDRSPLAPAISSNFDTLAYDLNSLYQKTTYQELKEILIANLLNAAEKLPELLVPGFGADEVVESILLNEAANSAPITKGTSKVKLALGKAEDVDDTDDVLAMADKIFNS